MSIVSAIQMTSTPDLKQNLLLAARLIQQAVAAGAELLVLPEMFPVMGADEEAKISISEPSGCGPIQDFLSTQAQKNKVWIVGGTIPIQIAEDKTRVRAACMVYNSQGEMVARYDKMHLFDACLTPGSEEYKESAWIAPGEHLIVIETPVGKLGLAVCYDMRFPELFRALVNQGAEIIAVPAAFTFKTGVAHWEILARSRAIENLVYAIYANQTGAHSPTRTTYGHSMVIDPWGVIIGILEEENGVISAEISLDYLRALRKSLPALEHQRIGKHVFP